MGLLEQTLCLCIMLSCFGSLESTHFLVTSFHQKDSNGVDITSYWQGPARSLLSCFVICAGDERCKTAAFSTDVNTCYLFSVNPSEYNLNSSVVLKPTFIHFKKIVPCKNGGTLQHTMDCVCIGGYIGSACEQLMQDCSEGFESGLYDDRDDIFYIQPSTSSSPFQVRCIMKDGGYTLIQRNAMPSIDFNRTWQEYRTGFGHLNESHWLGLDKIHYITSGRFQDAYVFITVEGRMFPNVRVYTAFVVKSATQGYRMEYSFSLAVPGYNDLGDSLFNLNGERFTTWDVDNDQSGITNCARAYGAGFWFNNCARCNPNGLIDGVDNGYDEKEAHWTYDLGAASVILTVEIRLMKSEP